MSDTNTQTPAAPTAATPAGAVTEAARAKRRVLQGVIRSDKMDKTVVVEVTLRVRHRTYGKFVLRQTRYKAHDERNEFRTGDTVRIVESRPRSRDKRWRVQTLVERPK